MDPARDGRGAERAARQAREAAARLRRAARRDAARTARPRRPACLRSSSALLAAFAERFDVAVERRKHSSGRGSARVAPPSRGDRHRRVRCGRSTTRRARRDFAAARTPARAARSPATCASRDRRASRIRQLLITGDFFVTPPRIVFDLEAALRGAYVDGRRRRSSSSFFRERTHRRRCRSTPGDFRVVDRASRSPAAARGAMKTARRRSSTRRPSTSA